MAASQSALRQMMLEAIARGEAIPAALDPEILMVMDAVVFRQHITTLEPLREDVATRIVDRILLPVVQSERYHLSRIADSD